MAQGPAPRSGMTRRFLVRGRVQGVGYRWFVRRKAEELGIAGRATNLDDGSVEVVARGGEAALAELARVLERGPSMAQVTSVEVTELPDDPSLTGFGRY
jgi:acylphosphatase